MPTRHKILRSGSLTAVLRMRHTLHALLGGSLTFVRGSPSTVDLFSEPGGEPTRFGRIFGYSFFIAILQVIRIKDRSSKMPIAEDGWPPEDQFGLK